MSGSPDQKETRVSIVTVNLNQAADLARTMDSVAAQSHDSIEYIVIDGGSTDGSVALLEERAAEVADWVSEPDRGIYDAMNKGVARATGDWIGFMNSGDRYVAEDTIETASRGAPADADLIYGDTVYLRKGKEIPFRVRPLERLWQGNCFSHQAMLCRTGLLKEEPFDINLNIIADYEFFLRCYMKNLKFHYCGDFMAVRELGGYSDRHVVRRTVERWGVVRERRPGLSTDLFYLLMTARSFVQQIRDR